MDPGAGLDALEKRDLLFCLHGLEPRFLSLSARSVVTVPTELSQLFSFKYTVFVYIFWFRMVFLSSCMAGQVGALSQQCYVIAVQRIESRTTTWLAAANIVFVVESYRSHK